MNFEEYVKECSKDLTYGSAKNGNVQELSYIGLGIGGEAGELVDQIKKIVKFAPVDNSLSIDDEMRQKLKLELGDVLWYIGQLCRYCDFNLSDILQDNLNKLELRRSEASERTAPYGYC